MVKIKALLDSVRRIAWKGGNVSGKVQHEIDPDGNHRIVVTVPKHLAEWEPPHDVTGATRFRDHPDLTWDEIKPPTPRNTKR